jgi:hypothetical protein
MPTRFPGGDGSFISFCESMMSSILIVGTKEYCMNLTRRKLLQMMGLGAIAASFPISAVAAEASPAVTDAVASIQTQTLTNKTLGGVIAGDMQAGPALPDTKITLTPERVELLEFPRQYVYLGMKWAYGTSNEYNPATGKYEDMPKYFGDWMKLGVIDNRSFRQPAIEGQDDWLYKGRGFPEGRTNFVEAEPVTFDMVLEAKELLYEASERKLYRMLGGSRYQPVPPYFSHDFPRYAQDMQFVVAPSLTLMTDIVEASMRNE